jgi:hypothetical protein
METTAESMEPFDDAPFEGLRVFDKIYDTERKPQKHSPASSFAESYGGQVAGFLPSRVLISLD